MADLFSKYPTNLDSPAKKAFAITPTDDTELTVSTRSLYVGGTGNLNVIFVGDTVNTSIVAVPAGSILPFRVKVVHSTGTTATSIVGLV